MVLWTYLYGTRAGDLLLLDLTGPEGRIIADRITLDRTQAQSFRAIGKRLRAAGWPSGSYAGRAMLSRDGIAMDETAVTLTLP